MKLTIKKITAAGILAISSMSANALLIDNNSYTTDTDSGLDWLDITSTVDRSYNEISQLFDAGEEFSGYRYATSEELNQLISNTSGVSITDVNAINYLPETNNISAADTLINLLGAVGSSGQNTTYIQALIGDRQRSDDLQYATIVNNDNTGESGDYTHAYHGLLANDNSSSMIGSFLVRSSVVSSVSEPATLSLFALGLAGLGFIRKKKQS